MEQEYDFKRLNKASQDFSARPREIDWTLTPAKTTWWLPPIVSPLSHCKTYQTWTEDQKKAYNHTYTTLVLDQFVFFENLSGDITKGYIFNNLRHKGLKQDFKEYAEHFDREEVEHIEMFQKQRSRIEMTYPHLQGQKVFKISKSSDFILRLFISNIKFFPFLLWIVLFIEERSTYLVDEFKALEKNEIDPLSYQVQISHWKDEKRHAIFVEEMLTKFWDPLPMWKKKFNLKILKYIFKNAFNNSYTALSVFEQTAQVVNFSDQQQKEATSNLRSLHLNKSYQRQLMSSKAAPKFWKNLEERKECAPILNYIKDSIY
jgi:hypothetical protein